MPTPIGDGLLLLPLPLPLLTQDGRTEQLLEVTPPSRDAAVCCSSCRDPLALLSANCWSCIAEAEAPSPGCVGDDGDRLADVAGRDNVGDSRDTRSGLAAECAIEKRLWEDKLFRGGGIGVLPKLLGTTEGGLTGAFFERGGTIRSFEEEIRVSSCRLCELSFMLELCCCCWLASSGEDPLPPKENGDDGVVEDTDPE